MIQWLKKHWEVLSYLIFGVLTTLLNILLYALFNRLFGYTAANSWGNVLDNILCILFAYATNRAFVFRSKTRGREQAKEFTAFVSCRLGTLLLDAAIMLVLGNLLAAQGAARNAEGLVIMYADEITDSMDRAITETERRRAIQMAYNKEHGIVPKTIVKAIPDSIEISDKAENAKMNTRRMGKLEREAAIDRLTREMKEAAKLLEFEHAAFLRDQIDRLRRGENPTTDSSAEQERKQNHAQTQRRGRKYLGKR